MRRKTTEEFIIDAINVHYFGTFNYERVVYKGSNHKVEIGCNTCGVWFWQTPHSHTSGSGCIKCYHASKRLTTGIFITRSVALWGDTAFNYSRVEYITDLVKVEIGCNTCGTWFWQRPSEHLKGYGCYQCSTKRKSNTAEFISKSVDRFGESAVDRSRVVYINASTEVELGCYDCGQWYWQVAYNHLRGNGCTFCCVTRKSNTNDFISKAVRVHGSGVYDYSRVVYKGSMEAVEIGCKSCGQWFWQIANTHLNGKGCSRCSASKGEVLVEDVLIKYNQKFAKQTTHDACFDKGLLKFDFYLEDWNLIIEYNGAQHYQVVDNWGGEQGLIDRQRRDQIKRDFCNEYGINLLEIPYTEFDNIEQIIVDFINSL